MNTFESTKTPSAIHGFRSLYLSHAPKLIYYACKYVDQHTAEDLVQDVFLSIWQKKAALFVQEGIKTYLFRSVQHACLDWLKHNEIEGSYVSEVTTKLKIEELYYHDNPEALFGEDDRIQSIYQEINKLPDKCKEVFTLAYLNEKKTSEIAIILNISTRTVEAQLYKALKLIRSALLSILLLLIFL